MGAVHFFRAKDQPATRYHFDLDIKGKMHRFVTKLKPRTRVWCRNCLRWRWAARCTVQTYYDGTYFSCRDKEKCKRKKRCGSPRARRRR